MSAPACPRCHSKLTSSATTCPSCGTSVGIRTRAHVAIRVVRADGGPEALVPMTSDTLTCGRKADLTIPDDPFVADVQARFHFSGGRLSIEDLGGGNGVFSRLREEVELNIGGEVRLGRQRLLLEPIAAAVRAPDGAMAWGTRDPGYRFRLIQLLEGGTRGAAFPLMDGETVLGRELGDITFPTDGFVSGRHALFQIRFERLFVKDLGSSNGTFIKLKASTVVDSGDQFLIGRQLLRVEVQAQKL